jgi:hypothetical protein
MPVVLRRARRAPGVGEAAVSDTLPPDRQGGKDTLQVEGLTPSPGEKNPVISRATVGPDFFRTLGIPLCRVGTSPVTIVKNRGRRRSSAKASFAASCRTTSRSGSA